MKQKGVPVIGNVICFTLILFSNLFTIVIVSYCNL